MSRDGPLSGESAAERRRRLARSARAAAARIAGHETLDAGGTAAARSAGQGAAQARRRGAGRDPGMPPPLQPGDLFVCAETSSFAVEWAVLEGRAGHPTTLFVVPADTNPLAGGDDLAVAAGTSVGPLTLRCAYGAWIAAEVLDGARRGGTLDPVTLEHARRKTRALKGRPVGAEAPAPAADADPDYEDWLAGNVAPARAALLRMSAGKAGKDVTAHEWTRVAALLALTLGLGATIGWQLHLHEERARREAGAEPAPLLNVAVVWLAPREGLRSAAPELVHLPRGAPKVVFVLALERRLPPAREVHLEIRRRDSGRRVWTARGLVPNERSEVTFELPRALLPDGEYQLLLADVGGRGGAAEASYAVTIGR
jgi:hypothetical protein